MPKNLFQESVQRELAERLSKLQPDSPRQFGKMTAPEMVCHLKDSLDVATGVRPAKSKNSFMANPVIRLLIMYVVPWPKGKAQTVPEMQVTRPGEWSSDVSNLKQLLASTARRGPNAPWAEHPAFGKLSGRQYARLIYKHFDHHLKQFGA